MSTVDDANAQLLRANWDRMRQAIERAAIQYERTAEELRAINFDSTAGVRRSPDAIISQAALTADPGRAYADLMHRLATWAESINEILQHPVATYSRALCSHRFGDLRCVLNADHGPIDAGESAHMTGDGVAFR